MLDKRLERLLMQKVDFSLKDENGMLISLEWDKFLENCAFVYRAA